MFKFHRRNKLMSTKFYKSRLKPISLIGLMVTVSLILAACTASVQADQGSTTNGNGSPNSAAVSTSSSSKPVSAASEAAINVTTDPTLGKILVDGKGMTLYIFTVDGPDQSNCDASCLTNWPPLLTQGSPTLGPGVDDSLVGSAALADGTRIVTYNHMPLYYFINDAKPGDTTGQGVGSVWYTLTPDGKPVGASGTSSATAAPVASVNEPTINVASDSTLGQFLVDGNGMSLYIFTKDGRDQSNCDASCLAKWPPLLTQGNPSVGPGVDASQVGVATLADGSKIVTYDHRPLYYWVKDTKPGDITGQGVGSVWFVISPTGQEIDSSPQAVADPTPDPVSSAAEPTLMLGTNSSLGEFLVDGKGMTLYIFTRDTADKSTCTGDCLVAWPPLLTQGNPILGPGVDDSKIGSTLLADGTRIVTYNHMPLYYYVKDTQPGDTTGQGVGGVWYVIDSDGDIIGK
jgi:predicted lipoprotein with Yx(FWY)xxD motif